MAQYVFCSKLKLPSREAMHLHLYDAIKDGLFSVHLPYEWSDFDSDGLFGKPPKDPLTIYFTFDVNGAEDLIAVKTTVHKLLKSTVELFSSHDGNLDLSEANVSILSAFRDALIKEANWIDRKMKEQRLKDKRERSIQD